jgi:uncharacterized protein
MLRPMSPPTYRASHRIPPRAGVGLKGEHAADILDNARGVAFFEVHAENYMGEGGAPHATLAQIRERFPLSLHGVGLSIGGAKPLCREHLSRLQRLVALYRPGLFSEHLAWSSHGDVYLNDLLPLPYNETTLARVTSHVDQVQKVLGIKMLLENPSTYVAFEQSTMSETEFLSEVVARTGCGLLLDVNNVHVSAVNHGFDPFAYLERFPIAAVGEIHLGGHAEERDADGASLLIDSHADPVADKVWALYEYAIERAGPVPTLIEWDNDVPSYPVLAEEAARADSVMHRFCVANFKRTA